MRENWKWTVLLSAVAVLAGIVLIGDRQVAARAGGQQMGVLRATVVDVTDPQLTRVKVEFRWQPQSASARSTVEEWAELVVPLAGRDFRLPEVGDEVLVAFEQGDARHPIVIGTIWNGSRDPEPAR